MGLGELHQVSSRTCLKVFLATEDLGRSDIEEGHLKVALESQRELGWTTIILTSSTLPGCVVDT